MENGVSRDGSCRLASIDGTFDPSRRAFYSVLVTQARRDTVSFRDSPGIDYQRVKWQYRDVAAG